jgi:hypothetical protein
MIELTTTPDHFNATLTGKRRAHPLTRTTIVPMVNDSARIAEVAEGQYTGRVAFARITHVETLAGPLGPMYVLSFTVGMTSDRMRAIDVGESPES